MHMVRHNLQLHDLGTALSRDLANDLLQPNIAPRTSTSRRYLRHQTTWYVQSNVTLVQPTATPIYFRAKPVPFNRKLALTDTLC